MRKTDPRLPSSLAELAEAARVPRSGWDCGGWSSSWREKGLELDSLSGQGIQPEAEQPCSASR
jgi:hypothetical protein